MLTGYNAEVDPSVFGISLQAMISLRLRQHDDISFSALFKELSARDEVINVYLLAGSNDFLVHVAARDVTHLRSLVLEAYSARSEIEQIETSLVFDFHHRTHLPNYRLPESMEENFSEGEYI
ncbi:Lrp/AsnC family transcriptional regulator [Adhaeretor mobilis]|uniref:Lrp/AsnC family transcriptional regulator n=1 Tax=Adhaeretor mobilis TaxID=1930276 RepID=UPI001FE916AF|nr:Lrp/AsnC family transcriptional regulator [Adhaeretor mobilis]